jgi:hypothetical protein
MRTEARRLRGVFALELRPAAAARSYDEALVAAGLARRLQHIGWLRSGVTTMAALTFWTVAASLIVALLVEERWRISTQILGR